MQVSYYTVGKQRSAQQCVNIPTCSEVELSQVMVVHERGPGAHEIRFHCW